MVVMVMIMKISFSMNNALFTLNSLLVRKPRVCIPTCLIDFVVNSTLHLLYSSVPFVSNLANGAFTCQQGSCEYFFELHSSDGGSFFENESTLFDDVVKCTIAEMDNPNGTEGG